MAYNLKLIEYPNGSVQIRTYSVVMKGKDPIDYFETSEPNEIQIKDGYALNPFDYKPVKVVKEFEELEISEEEKEENRYRNANRTKQMVFQYSRCGAWEWFITLTFSQDKVDRYNYDECSAKARQWLHNQRKNAPNLQYILVPEQHKDGAWHFHGLLANTGDMKFINSGKKDKGQPIYNMVKYQYGFTTATKVTDINRVSKYIGKYITKNVCDLTPGKQRYFVSNNLPKPTISTFLFDGSEDMSDIVNSLCSSLGKEIGHVSHTCPKNDSYTQVNYIELI